MKKPEYAIFLREKCCGGNQEGNAAGKELKEALDDGGFASDELIIRMVEERIGKEDCRHGFLLDGFPRTLNQAEILEEMLAEKRQKLDAVIEIQVPDEIIMERILGRYACMKCGRGVS